MWQRDTPWRQGHILTKDSVRALGLDDSGVGDDIVVLVVSHDCDLAQDPKEESLCEAIVGVAVDAADGTYANAKNPRRLHLEFAAGELLLVGDFLARDKRFIKKSDLADHAPAEKVRLAEDDLRVLRNWLANRYHRSAFSDAFDLRLKTGPRDFYGKFQKAAKQSAGHVLAILFNVKEPVDPAHPHVLDAYVLYRTTPDPGPAEKAALSLRDRIQEIFENAFLTDGVWTDIELRDCDVMADEAMTVAQRNRLQAWEFDHLSIASDDDDPLLHGG